MYPVCFFSINLFQAVLSIKQKLFKKGEKYGITEMIRIVEEDLKDPSCRNGEEVEILSQTRDQIQILYDIVSLDRSRGYKGKRRGEESCLPSPEIWPENIFAGI